MLTTRTSLLILIVLMGVGLVTVLVMKMLVSMETATIITVLLIPFLAFAALSGTIEELGFGGLKARFTNAANTKMNLSELGNMLPSSSEFDQVGQEGQAAIEEMLSDHKFNDTRPIVLSIKLGRGDYSRSKMLAFVRELSRHPSFKLVIFLDRYDRVIAFMPGWAALQLLADDEDGERFISLINKNEVKELLDLPKMNQTLLTMQDNNADILRQMSTTNVEALPVIDMNRFLRGVVVREDVVAEIVQALVHRPIS